MISGRGFTDTNGRRERQGGKETKGKIQTRKGKNKHRRQRYENTQKKQTDAHESYNGLAYALTLGLQNIVKCGLTLNV